MFAYNTVHQGDCREVLKRFAAESFDMALTDPPYLVGYRDRRGRTVANDDNAQDILRAFDGMYRVLKPNTVCISFYGWMHIDAFAAARRRAGFRVIGHIVWCKSYPSKVSALRYRHEPAYLLAKGYPAPPRQLLDDVRVWQYSGNQHHPTEKSVAILKPLIEAFSPAGGAVLDPFAGSGSTLLAALAAGRRYCGVELEAEHCATIRGRLSRAGAPPHPVTALSDLERTFEGYGRWLAARGWRLPGSLLADAAMSDAASAGPEAAAGAP